MKLKYFNKRQEGFSLLELLFALTIMATGMLALATAFPSSYLRVEEADSRENAARLAQTVLETAKTVRFDKLNAAFEAEYTDDVDVNQDDDALGGSDYEYRIVEILDDQPCVGMKTVRVRVRWLRLPLTDQNNDTVADASETELVLFFDEIF